jgi:hypothetical protein
VISRPFESRSARAKGDPRLGGAQAQLEEALDELSTVAHNRALLAQRDVLLSAAQLLSLHGET